MTDISIVVPCYNEEARIDSQQIDRYLVSDKSAGVELTLVNDGSTDRTLEVLRAIEAKHPGRVRVLDQQPNQGKAEAVRLGMLDSIDRGARYAGYWDADLATPLEAIAEFAAVLDDRRDIDLVMGARVALLGRHIDRSRVRHYLGRVFATAASMALALPVYDTQCGAKLLRVTAISRSLFEEPFASRWIFDVELIARYLRVGRGPGAVFELPLQQWTDVGDSKVNARDFVRAIGEMITTYRTYPPRSRGE
ncbi:MAG: glycosyltransferase [Myxococcales bacterium]|nr:glycosyltransferase [Myxococcales bacterium]